jgi:hypothetical protein
MNDQFIYITQDDDDEDTGEQRSEKRILMEPFLEI